MKKLLLTSAAILSLTGSAHAVELDPSQCAQSLNRALCVYNMLHNLPSIPWSKNDSSDTKYNRFNERLKIVSRIPTSQATDQVSLLVAQGYADGDPKLKAASDWVCQKMRETPGAYIETCIQRQAQQEAIERKRKQDAKDAWDRTPLGRVFNSYFKYATLKLCFDVRLGYELIYISDYELDRAEEATK